MDSTKTTSEVNYNMFLEKIRQYIPTLLDGEKNQEINRQKKYIQGYISFRSAQNMSFITEKLHDNMFVNILYTLESKDKKHLTTVAYSMPYSDELYAIQMESGMYGIIMGLSVIFYESLDIMFNQLREKYQGLENSNMEVKEKEKPEVFFSRFK